MSQTLHDVLGQEIGPLVDSLYSDERVEPTLILHTLKKIRQMLKELRAYAQGELEKGKKPSLEPVAIEDMLREIYTVQRATAQNKGLELRLKLPESLPRPRLDPVLIGRCIGNLVTNSIKYTLHGFIEISARAEERNIVVCVSDTGIGIPTEHLARIFQAGYRVPGNASMIAEGSGVGLANVQEMMAAMGGYVDVKSQLDKGSEFYLYFPLPPEITDVKAKVA